MSCRNMCEQYTWGTDSKNNSYLKTFLVCSKQSDCIKLSFYFIYKYFWKNVSFITWTLKFNNFKITNSDIIKTIKPFVTKFGLNGLPSEPIYNHFHLDRNVNQYISIYHGCNVHNNIGLGGHHTCLCAVWKSFAKYNSHQIRHSNLFT